MKQCKLYLTIGLTEIEKLPTLVTLHKQVLETRTFIASVCTDEALGDVTADYQQGINHLQKRAYVVKC